MKEPTIFVNLIGEEYEPQIPGTKCPVSAEVLDQWYWGEGLCLRSIRQKIEATYLISVNNTSIRRWMIKSGKRLRTRVNACLISQEWRDSLNSRKITQNLRTVSKKRTLNPTIESEKCVEDLHPEPNILLGIVASSLPSWDT